MLRTIRFHLDENCDPRIATGLRLHGVDITTTPDVGLLRAPDEGHLAFASAHYRVIVTRDQDFLVIASVTTDHPGIVFYDHRNRSIEQIIRGLLLLWELLEPDELRNRIEFI